MKALRSGTSEIVNQAHSEREIRRTIENPQQCPSVNQGTNDGSCGESIKESKSDNGIIITLERNAKNENGELVLSTYENYQVMRSGDIRINYKLIKSEWVPSFPKIGVQMKVSDELVTTEWVGYAQATKTESLAVS